MPIQWRPELSVGNHVIDHDHQYLIALVNNVELILRHPEDKNDLDFVVDRLHEYALEHFKREQDLQAKIRYPHRVEHEAEHRRLLEALAGIRSELKGLCVFEHPDPSELKEGINRLMELLRHWLIDHVVKSDIHMREYFEKGPATMFWKEDSA